MEKVKGGKAHVIRGGFLWEWGYCGALFCCVFKFLGYSEHLLVWKYKT